MGKIDDLKKDLTDNQREISTLQTFRQTRQVKELLRQLFAENSYIKSQLRKLLQTQQEKEKARKERVQKQTQTEVQR